MANTGEGSSAHMLKNKRLTRRTVFFAMRGYRKIILYIIVSDLCLTCYNACMRIRKKQLGRLSFGAILVVLLCLLFTFLPSYIAYAANQTESGQVTVSGRVPGPPPDTPPTIDSPTDGTTFEQKNIEVKGSCVVDLIVKVFRNNIFAGSAICQPDETYSLFIDLYEGRNDLIARQYDDLNQSSPDSDTITVYYVPPAAQPTLPESPAPSKPTPGRSSPGAPPAPGVAEFQLIINYDYTQQGVFTNQPFRFPIQFMGGTSPYAISIDWGDDKTNVYSRQNSDKFTTDHIYRATGYKIVIIRVSDSKGNQAYLQFVVLVSGIDSPFIAQLFGKGCTLANWQTILFWCLLAAIIGFLIGLAVAKSKYLEKKRLKKRIRKG